MAPLIPDPKKIKSFCREAAFETWLAANHARETEWWLKFHKKGSGLHMRTPAGRAKKIATLVAMLERGETIVPERRR